MVKFVRESDRSYVAQPVARVRLMSRADLALCSYWQRAFANKRKDRRYYELVEDTIREGFDYRYFAIADEHGEVIAIQPFFLLDQDLIAGVSVRIRVLINSIRCA
jgi:hypothetical protein